MTLEGQIFRMYELNSEFLEALKYPAFEHHIKESLKGNIVEPVAEFLNNVPRLKKVLPFIVIGAGIFAFSMAGFPIISDMIKSYKKEVTHNEYSGEGVAKSTFSKIKVGVEYITTLSEGNGILDVPYGFIPSELSGDAKSVTAKMYDVPSKSLLNKFNLGTSINPEELKNIKLVDMCNSSVLPKGEWECDFNHFEPSKVSNYVVTTTYNKQNKTELIDPKVIDDGNKIQSMLNSELSINISKSPFFNCKEGLYVSGSVPTKSLHYEEEAKFMNYVSLNLYESFNGKPDQLVASSGEAYINDKGNWQTPLYTNGYNMKMMPSIYTLEASFLDNAAKNMQAKSFFIGDCSFR